MPPELEQELLVRMARLETHMEQMAVNQMNLSTKVDKFLDGCGMKHLSLEHRMTSVEHKSGLYALIVSAIVGLFANIRSWLS